MTKTIGGGAPDGLTIVTSMSGADLIAIWRDSNGDTRAITWNNFVSGLATGSGSMTGGGTVATGGFTLTAPATGTAALLGRAQTFTANQAVTARMTAQRFFTEDISSLADDDATTVDPAAKTGMFLFNCTTGGIPQQRAQALVGYRCESGQTAFIYISAQPASNPVESTTGALGGTNGSDGVITISPKASDELIYIENRTGGSIDIKLTFFG